MRSLDATVSVVAVDEVDDRATEVRVEGVRVPQVAQPCPRLDECVLDEVFRESAVARQEEGQRIPSGAWRRYRSPSRESVSPRPPAISGAIVSCSLPTV